jgi:hypothetical protein
LPVLIEFVDKKDKADVYSLCKTGLEKTEMVVTEDARLGPGIGCPDVIVRSLFQV